jgi:hypothetical protein
VEVRGAVNAQSSADYRALAVDRKAGFNGGQRVEDHFVEITEMVDEVPHLRS